MIKKTIEYIKIPKKSFYIAVAVICVILIAVFMKPQSTLVDVTTIEAGLFQKIIVDEGFTEFKNKHTLTAPADGIIPSHNLKAGDPVKKGQKLLSFLWDQDFNLKSPVDGFILQVFEKDKKHVMRGTPLLEVGSPDEVEIISHILTEEVVEIKEGMKSQITKWGGKTPLEGIVKKIEPSAKEEVSALGVKEQRVNVHIEITTDKKIWSNIGDGFRVEVAIITREVPDSLLIPVGALFSNEKGPALFVIEKNKIKLINVEIGEQNKDYAELKTAISPGTKVVLYPGSSLSSGDKIKIRNP